MVKWKHGCLQNSYAPVRFWLPPQNYFYARVAEWYTRST